MLVAVKRLRFQRHTDLATKIIVNSLKFGKKSEPILRLPVEYRLIEAMTPWAMRVHEEIDARDIAIRTD